MPQEGEGQTFTTQESTELLQFIAQNMLTKADAELMIAKSNSELRDYIDKKDREYKGELNGSLRKEDEKVDEVIETLADKRVINSAKANELKNLTPFPARSPL